MRPPPHNLADCTATELVQLYRTGAASPVEATQAVLEAPNFRIVSIAALLGEAVKRTALEKSVSSLFD